jgi:hypothetical protein
MVTNLLEYAPLVLNTNEKGWHVNSFTRTFRSTPSTVTGADFRGYRTCSLLMAKVLFDREHIKVKNRQRCFQGYQSDIGFPRGESSHTIVFHLVCQQNIGEFRFQDCMEIHSNVNKLSEWCSLTLINVKLEHFREHAIL